MPNATRCLRNLVIAEWAFAAAAGVAWAIEIVLTEQQSMPSEDLGLENATVTAFFVLLAGPLLVGLHIAASVGLFLLRRWARQLYLASSILVVSASAAIGSVDGGGVVETLSDLSAASWGGILALLYFSDASRHFRKPAAPKEADGGVPRAVNA